MLSWHKRPARLAVIGLALIVLGVAACTTPTETEIPMGQHLQLTFAPATEARAEVVSLLGNLQPVLDRLQDRPEIDDLSVSVREIDGGPVTIDLIVWGRDVDPRTIVSELTAAHPVLGKGQVESAPLTGTLRESLASKLGRELFSFEVSGQTAEEIRAEVLAQLAAQGFQGEAKVDVQVEGGRKTIGIELSGTAPAGTTAGEDGIILELEEQ
jgi:hypothetical protein